MIVATVHLFNAWCIQQKLPPGPRGLPIIGNLLQIPSSRQWLTFSDWSKKYGPIFYLNIAGQHTVILGTHKAAMDLLDKRANIYSGRAQNIVAGELLTGGMVFAFAQHNELWRKQRRGAHEALNHQMSKNYHDFQETECVVLLDQLMTAPNEWDNHLRRASASLVLRVIYGTPPLLDSQHPDIVRVNHFTERALSAAAPGAFWVEYFTWMKYLPRWMCPWRQYAEDSFNKDSAMFENLFSHVEKRINAGDDTPSVAATLLSNPSKKGVSHKEAAWLAATLYAAGAETTSSQLAWFIQAMILFPETQKTAQEELDHVVGANRLPSFDDYPKLPYIQAMVKEIMRWRGIAPLGVPHRLCEDDYYEGHFLPRNTICIPNIWALHKDTTVYGEDVDNFNPHRHLNKDGSLKTSIPNTNNESHFNYGFGRRRICVGRHIASNSMFIEIACLLWAFNIRAENDSKGRNILPDSLDSIDEGLVVRPAPFSCQISPRNMELTAILAQAKTARGL
ncbi:cytochrome P450 [Lentinula lateritia]|uniref:Cytochrome P450 n=1 Tax=Lentinula aff. lateritia TaxID=2804960 RepID=A0ACC1TIB9_9AGAR|nr:cytochrome P450 [Lentinula aff. lateritia]KAJ3846835.1 cytochrome P450 [Lentinula lateritia]